MNIKWLLYFCKILNNWFRIKVSVTIWSSLKEHKTDESQWRVINEERRERNTDIQNDVQKIETSEAEQFLELPGAESEEEVDYNPDYHGPSHELVVVDHLHSEEFGFRAVIQVHAAFEDCDEEH